jgi:cysteinyl-tRNA synthetase
VIRFVMLSTHYRKPMDWTEKKAREAEATLRKWRAMVDDAQAGSAPDAVVDMLSDDLNTPGAIAELHKLAAAGDGAALKAAAALVGLLGEELGGWKWRRELETEGTVQFVGFGDETHGALARRVAKKWQDLRAARNFAEADEIKKLALDAGLELRVMKAAVQAEALPGFDPSRLEKLK